LEMGSNELFAQITFDLNPPDLRPPGS
jgi:hypothetical protein